MKRKLQMMLLLCVAFLCMPMTAKAAVDEAKIGETGYPTLQEAVDAVKDGETIVLQKDIVLKNDVLFIANKSFIINGNGNKISGNSEKNGIVHLIDIKGSNVTFKNISDIYNSSNLQYVFAINTGSIVNFEKTTISSKGKGIIATDSKINLIDSSIFIDAEVNASLDYRAVEIGKGSTVNLNNSILQSIGKERADHGIYGLDNSNINFSNNSKTTGFRIGICNNNGVLTMTGGKIYGNVTGVFNGSVFNMTGGNISGNDRNGINNKGTMTMSGGTISKNKWNGIGNSKKFTITNGEISGNGWNGVYNDNFRDTNPELEMHGGKIIGSTQSGVVNDKGATFKMYGGEISGNTKGVENNGDFAYNSDATITKNGTTSNDDIVTESGANTDSNLVPKEPPVVPTPNPSEGESGDSNFEEPVMITDSEGNTFVAPEMWVPTTPDEIKRYAFLGKEAVEYVCAASNAYGIKLMNAMQGPMCFVSFEAVLGDYTMGRTYNAYVNGKLLYSMDTKATITLNIPKDLQKEGRTFKMICVTEGGLPIVLNDLDKNPETITFETDKFYAFALIYK